MNLGLMRVIDKQFMETPFHGVRQMTWHLRNEDHLVNEKRIRRLMRLMGLMPMRRGFLYLVVIMDWHTRKVLAWQISNTLETDFCDDALNEAIHKFGPPEIMNTDQGSQFTSLHGQTDYGVQLSASQWMARAASSTTSS